MGKGPEADLLTLYEDRLKRLPQKWTTTIAQVDDRQAPSTAERKAWDAKKIAPLIPDGAYMIALDERGKTLSSPALSKKLTNLEDEARPICFAIGGPDGLDDAMRRRADFLLSFGAMTWPHKLVRAMLLEQLYRAGAIASGHPYHRV